MQVLFLTVIQNRSIIRSNTKSVQTCDLKEVLAKNREIDPAANFYSFVHIQVPKAGRAEDRCEVIYRRNVSNTVVLHLQIKLGCSHLHDTGQALHAGSR